jgi:arylsulfatase A-like enzyme
LTPKPQGSDITDAATAWLARVGTSPFFLFLNYLDAHAPYDPPPPFDRRFAPEKPARSIDLNLAFEDIDRGARELRPDEREFLWARYDGEIAYQDTQVGRLLSWMDSKGLLDRTLVIITSDHGEFFGEHGLVFHLGPLYEPVLQIPLLVKPPGMGRGEEVSRRVTLGAVPSLIRRVLDGARTRRDLFGEQDSGDEPIEAEIWMPESYHRRNPARYSSRAMRAVYRGNLKLIQTDTAHAELFDLHRDPGEARNLFTEDPVAAARIAAEMTRSLPALRVEPTVSLPVPALSLDVLEQLRGLGYLH